MKKLLILPLLLLSLFVFSQEKPEGLFIYSKAPEFKATDQNGKEIALKEIRKKSPVVIVFYRGYWCPYCNKELKKLQDSLDLITAKGATLIAITPENEEGIKKTVENTGASFSIISDADQKIMKAYNVSFKVDDKTVSRYKMGGIDLATNNSQKTDAVYLPVPAVYVIDTDGEIRYRFFDADYKKRPAIADILKGLEGIK